MYNKLFTKILDSSIWLEPLAVRVVWITLIASMDEDSYAHFSAIENLARRAGVTLEEAASAVEILMAPDANSGDPEFEGRRIERIPGGFVVLNGPKYRALFSKQIQREKTRQRVAKHRAKKDPCNTTTVTGVLPSVTGLPEAEAEAEAEYKDTEGAVAPCVRRNGARFVRPALEEVLSQCRQIGLEDDQAQAFIDYYESNGWKVGKNSMKSWPHALANWKRGQRERKATAVNSPHSLKTILQAKETQAQKLKLRNCTEGPLGNTWKSEESRQQFKTLQAEITSLNNKIAAMA